jgi:homoserine kinase
MKIVKAFAPATVANVCCGFDILGFSVDSPGDEVILTEKDEPGVVVKSIVGDGGRLPREAHLNTASVAVQSFLNAIGSNRGFEIDLFKNLPLGSGMGSSAASAVAALVGINHLFGSPLTREELIPHAMEAERIACGSAHADNVAPSLLGGFVLVRDYHPLDVVKIPVAADLYCTLVHPQIELKTEDARRVLRSSVSLNDAITQSGNIAGLMVGLMSGNNSLISRSLKDVIAEPVRSVFIPGFDAVRSEALKAGALGSGISGSGPTLFALSASHEIALQVGETMQLQFLKYHLKSEAYVSKINLEGARVIN